MRLDSWSHRAFSAASIAILTAAFLWPALVTGAPWAFQDTPSYYKGGAAAWTFLLESLGVEESERAVRAKTDLIVPAVLTASGSFSVPEDGIAATRQTFPPGQVPTAKAELFEIAGPDTNSPVADGNQDKPNVRYGIRSVPYSILVYTSVRFMGLWAPIVAMSLATATLVWMTARDLPPVASVLLGLGLAATTVLPFFGALFQPDILTAAVVLVPVVIMLHADRLGTWAIIALFGLMGFATLTHYANLPLAGVAVIWLGIWGLMRRRRLIVALVAVPLVAAVTINLAIAVAIKSGPSLAPGRYPLLLARSIEDGPGYDYLTEVCPNAKWAICEVYEKIPSDIFAFLWGERSISEVATPDQLARVSAEELPLLLAIVRYDPWGQTLAFLENSTRQFFLFGSAISRPVLYVITPRTMEIVTQDVPWTPTAPEFLQNIVVALGVAGLVIALARRRHPEAYPIVFFLLVSLIVFAAVCGGLSAPAPRYQARLIWIVPLLGAVLAYGRSRHPVIGNGSVERSA